MSKQQSTWDKANEALLLYEKLGSMAKVAREMGISKAYVYKLVKKAKETDYGERAVNEFKKAREQANQDIIKRVRSAQYSNVFRQAVNLLEDENNLKHEIESRGIGNIIKLQGNIVDKTVALEELELKKRQMDVKERELAIKEKELELRERNPEAFQEVHIINDAPKNDYAS